MNSIIIRIQLLLIKIMVQLLMVKMRHYFHKYY